LGYQFCHAVEDDHATQPLPETDLDFGAVQVDTVADRGQDVGLDPASFQNKAPREWPREAVLQRNAYALLRG